MPVEKDDLIGRVVAGQFRIASHLGTGAMATIYRARDEEAGRDVALKIVKPELMRNKTAAARFHREAKAASKLEHPGIVRVIAWGFDEELPYLAMELVEGEDLFELLDRRGALSEEESLLVVMALCGALHTAHEQGVVHRDLKPENIMVGGLEEGSTEPVHIKVLDFGIAKLVGPGSGDMWGDETVPQALTKVGSAVGTPSHMAPEQARGDPVDGRTDIYACGVLLYEMVTGHLPFEGDNPLHVAIRQVRDPPPPPRSHRPDLHPELEAIILKMLEKEPGARFQTVAELEQALGHVLRDIDPDHQTAQRNLVEDADDVRTALREVPAEIRDHDFEQPTAQREIPASLRGMIDKRAVAVDSSDVPTVDDGDDDLLTHVVHTQVMDEPATMELDTVAGRTMRRKVQNQLRDAIAAADSLGPRALEVARAMSEVSDEPTSNDPTPFVGRSTVPRPVPKTQLSIEHDARDERPSAPPAETGPHGTFRVESPDDRPSPESDLDIDDEDSEGAIPTVVADPADMSSEVAQSVMKARAIAEASVQQQHKRNPALSVTKQSDFGAFIDLSLQGASQPAPAIEVVSAPSEPSPSSFVPISSFGPPSMDPPGSRQTNTAPDPVHAQLSVAPNTRGAAHELEDLLRQMPRARQPIIGSVVVLVFLGVAIVALLYLLVGVATF